MRGGPLSNPAVVELLRPFVVTSWHGGNESVMPADVKEVFQASEVTKPPRRGNVFLFVLDHEGRPVHSFHGLPAGRRGGAGRSDYAKEIPNALAKLGLPAEKRPGREEARPVVLPDLPAAEGAVPAGVRLFVRSPGRKPVVEVVAMNADDRKALAFPVKASALDAATLRGWLVQLYPQAIRAVDANKPFTRITGSLKLEPAGAAKGVRYALLSGEVKLAKGDETASAFEGTLRAVLTYGPDTPEVKSVRAVVEGDYLYRVRGTQRIPLVAAIESRPE